MSKEMAQDLRTLADRFSEGWHDGIKIDASDIMLLTDAAQALEEQPAQHTWVGLTDEEVHALWMTGEANISEEHHSVVAYEIEAKLRELNEHREKNT